MRVYHTSYIKIKSPDTLNSRNALDFGRGFYVTKLRDQAIKYGKRFTALGDEAFLHQYEYTPLPELKIKVFDSYNREWLDFVSDCRRGGDAYKAFDIIEGGVANDNVFRTVDLYMNGIYTAEQALQNLIYEKPNHQISFITQKAIYKCLKFINCIIFNI